MHVQSGEAHAGMLGYTGFVNKLVRHVHAEALHLSAPLPSPAENNYSCHHPNTPCATTHGGGIGWAVKRPPRPPRRRRAPPPGGLVPHSDILLAHPGSGALPHPGDLVPTPASSSRTPAAPLLHFGVLTHRGCPTPPDPVALSPIPVRFERGRIGRRPCCNSTLPNPGRLVPHPGGLVPHPNGGALSHQGVLLVHPGGGALLHFGNLVPYPGGAPPPTPASSTNREHPTPWIRWPSP
uniref:Uncharacterized protein n=1 Tax=Setaria viridis TaxID=4556 RepID=A0A4U6UKC1_SETVI|nr:hypothetical protein SEVIR_5G243500v2 [Setaria viridis]